MKSLDKLIPLLELLYRGRYSNSETNEEFKQALQDYVREECRAVINQREALIELSRLGQEEECWGKYGGMKTRAEIENVKMSLQNDICDGQDEFAIRYQIAVDAQIKILDWVLGR